jgi:hypothetical protein
MVGNVLQLSSAQVDAMIALLQQRQQVFGQSSSESTARSATGCGAGGKRPSRGPRRIQSSKK